jgi:steroid 5-alpha reductase family enzyme
LPLHDPTFIVKAEMNGYETVFMSGPPSGLALAILLFVGLWLASLVLRDASLVDRFWGASFVLLAWWYAGLGGGPDSLAAQALLILVTVWGLRLSLYLTWRNWGHGEDYRYAEMRQRHGTRFGLVSLGTVFLLQAVLAWVIAMPLYAGLAAGAPVPGRTLLLWLGVAAWLVGFGFETVGDAQLARHRADASRRGRVLDTGLWRYTRHPNYFGDALAWWGHWLIATSLGGGWTIFAPLLMTFLLMRVSGVTLLERKLAETRPAYRDYAARTNAFFPGPPRPP